MHADSSELFLRGLKTWHLGRCTTQRAPALLLSHHYLGMAVQVLCLLRRALPSLPRCRVQWVEAVLGSGSVLSHLPLVPQNFPQQEQGLCHF